MLAMNGTILYFIPSTIRVMVTNSNCLYFTLLASLDSYVDFFTFPLTRSSTLFFSRIRSILFFQDLKLEVLSSLFSPLIELDIFLEYNRLLPLDSPLEWLLYQVLETSFFTKASKPC